MRAQNRLWPPNAASQAASTALGCVVRAGNAAHGQKIAAVLDLAGMPSSSPTAS